MLAGSQSHVHIDEIERGGNAFYGSPWRPMPLKFSNLLFDFLDVRRDFVTLLNRDEDRAGVSEGPKHQQGHRRDPRMPSRRKDNDKRDSSQPREKRAVLI